MGLRQQARNGAIWLVGSQIINMGAAFSVAVILARILEIADFGLLALSTLVFVVGTMLASGIFRDTIILRQDLDNPTITALLWINVLLAVLVAGVIVAIAGPVARMLDSPVFEPLLWTVAVSTVAAGIGTVPGAIRVINKDFARIGIQTGLLSVALAPITVVLALRGYGPFSVALTGMAYYILLNALHWHCSGWRPLLQFEPHRIRKAGRTLLILLGQQTIDVANFHADRAIIGSLLGPHQLGLYSMGRRLNDLIMDAVVYPAFGVATPLIASLKGNKERLCSAYVQTLSIAVLFAIPANLGLLVAGDLVIHVLFGERWLAAAPVVQAFACLGLITAINSVQRAIIQGGGRQDIWLGIQATQAVANVLVIVAAAPFGLVAISYVIVARAYILSALAFAAAGRMTGFTWIEQLAFILRPALAGLAMAGVVALTRVALPAGFTPAVKLAILVPIGAFAYVTITALLAREQFLHALSLITPDRFKKFGIAAADPLLLRPK